MLVFNVIKFNYISYVFYFLFAHICLYFLQEL